MKENLFLPENLSAKDRVSLAINQINGLTREIADQMGDQWKTDRFGEYKSEHMKKMANNFDLVIKRYGLDEDKTLKPYLPLFEFICRSHDLGRHFHDDKNYVDSNGKFVDHGEISVLILNENHILDNFEQDENNIIEYAIKNHSLKKTAKPKNESEILAQKFCHVLRDIDKVEILNKHDFMTPKEIYRLLGLHFNLDNFKEKWENANKKMEDKQKYIMLIEKILNGDDYGELSGLEKIIEAILTNPILEKQVDLFEERNEMDLTVFKDPNSYPAYILFQFSLLAGIKYPETFRYINREEIKIKLDYLKNNCTNNQFERIKSVLVNKYQI